MVKMVSNAKLKKVEELAGIDIDRDVRQGRRGSVEENVKIKLTIPLLGLLGYSVRRDMDFEHHVRNKRADIALMFGRKPRMIVETKSLDENLDSHVEQALGYAFDEGINWVMLTSGIETRLYKSLVEGAAPRDRVLFSTDLSSLPQIFPQLEAYASKRSLRSEKALNERVEHVRASITTNALVGDLAFCREVLYTSLYTQFSRRYKSDRAFKSVIDSWARSVQMDPSDSRLIDKLCKEGAYALTNRLLFLRICEDKGFVKPKLTDAGIKHWREMTAEPLDKLVSFAFEEIGAYFSGLYHTPLFDNISYEDIEWDDEVIATVLSRFKQHDFSKISRDIIGRAYEQHIPKEERKRLGQFYTPDFVIDYIVGRVGLKPDSRVLDPACGSGGFLIRAYDALRELRLRAGTSEETVHSEVLSENLFGIDINPFAVQLTVMNLLLRDLDHPLGRVNIAAGDTLEKAAEGSYAELLREAPFDAVVGNPPYISFGARGTRGKGKKDLLDAIRHAYPNSAEYKISIYAVFMDRALQLLREGGEFGFIVPDSFLLGRYFSKIRRHILDTCKIKEVVLFQKDFWQYGVVGRPVIIMLQKEPDGRARAGNRLTAKLCLKEEDLETGNFRSHSYRQDYFEALPFNRFRLFFDAPSKQLVETMERDSMDLGDMVEIHVGIRSKVGQRGIVSDTKKGANWKRGLVSGSEVTRYSVDYAGNYIRVDPKVLWSGGFDPELVLQDKLLMRKTGDSLISAYDDKGYYHLDNLHFMVPKGAEYSLKYVLAVLNSSLMNHYYHLISLEFGRAMAQTDIETLERLPIKPIPMPEQQRFARLVDRRLSGQALDKQIDARVMDLYGVSSIPDGVW
ncbi:N-6 DNA methylase [Candidatus Woesearchaeota archaeon]|nr:N-6 DNA methylase [Candidatus Woesearchaeota archaeon]